MNGQTREQQRAIKAYAAVKNVPEAMRKDYKPRVHGLGAAVLRDGLAAALTFLERERELDPKKENAATRLLDDLARALDEARLPGLPSELRGPQLPESVRALKLEEYILATREMLRLVVWFRRAVQATFKEESATHAG